eukprot:2146094-Pyramimonas_sp.AAC.1
MTDPSDAGYVGIFSRRTHRTQDMWVYSHDGPGVLSASLPLLAQEDRGAVRGGSEFKFGFGCRGSVRCRG